jgi:hypothetical protein
MDVKQKVVASFFNLLDEQNPERMEQIEPLIAPSNFLREQTRRYVSYLAPLYIRAESRGRNLRCTVAGCCSTSFLNFVKPSMYPLLFD